MDDRVLRDIVVGIGEPLKGIARETGFDITAASEVMAIFCLAGNLADLKARLGAIHVGDSPDGKPVFARDIKAAGAMTALLKDALNPNLVQTLEGTPALIHGGPFANIAHGTNSVIATRLGLRLVDYRGHGNGVRFGPGRGEVLRHRRPHGPRPAAGRLRPRRHAPRPQAPRRGEAVDVNKENVAAVEKGLENLAKHIENLRAVRRARSSSPSTCSRRIRSRDRPFSRPSAAPERRPLRPERRLRQGRGGRPRTWPARCWRPSTPTRTGSEFLYPLEMPLVGEGRNHSPQDLWGGGRPAGAEGEEEAREAGKGRVRRPSRLHRQDAILALR